MTLTHLVIIGAGGFGREVHDVLEAIEDVHIAGPAFDFLGFIDDGNPDKDLLADRGELIGGLSSLNKMPDGTQYVVAVSNGAARARIDMWATDAGLEPATLVHPSATIGRHGVRIGPGSVICAHASLTTNIRLGRHVHVNLNVTIGHDADLGDYVTVYPGATISGNVRLENQVSVGTGAAVIQGVTVGQRSFIGAAAGVVRDIPPDVTAVGVPARPRT